MTRVRKGNILLKLSEENLQKALTLYFERKYFNVFIPNGEKDLRFYIKGNAIMFALFDDNNSLQASMDIANSILDFDDKVVIYFICNSIENKRIIQQANPLFFTMTTPLVMRNLLSNMQSKASQLREQHNNITSFALGIYRYNTQQASLTYKINDYETEQHLTKKENMILSMLCRNMGKMVSKHRLLTEIWNNDSYRTARSMDVYITRLRKYLSQDDSIVISNTHSLGYRIKVIDSTS